MKSVGVLLVSLLLYLNGLCTAANEGGALLAFTNPLNDTMGCLRGNSNTSKNWNSAINNNYCGWFGVICNNENSVIILILGNCGLSGTLGTGLANLISLQKLFLLNNFITGNIPEEIGSLTELVVLDLSYNHLSGTLPTTFSNLAKLEMLSLKNNLITGTITEDLVNGLTNVDYMDLSDNFLEGNLPSTLSNLGMFNVIDLSNNHLNGTIPNTLNMHIDGYINLSYNLFSGSVTASWGVNIKRMSAVDLTHNLGLSGRCTEHPCLKGEDN